jgi:transcriptional regulator with XRE-family HTH domain
MSHIQKYAAQKARSRGVLRSSSALKMHAAMTEGRAGAKPQTSEQIARADKVAEHDKLQRMSMQGNLQHARKHKQMTLERLASQTGLTRGYLSMVERGLKVPSISALLKISSVLDINVAELFDANATATPRYTVYRGQPGKALVESGEILIPIAAQMTGKLMEPFLFNPPFSASPIGIHRGDEMLFVVSGRIELNLAGNKIELGAGECIYFRAEQEHILCSIGKRQAEVLIVISGSDDAIHSARLMNEKSKKKMKPVGRKSPRL